MTVPVPVNGSAPQPPPFFDPTNPYNGEVPAQLTTDVVNGPVGQRLGLKIHIPNTTLVLVLAKDDATAWRDALSAGISRMNGLILPG